MARMVKKDKNEARERYAYFAYPRKLERTFEAMILEEAGKYGIENVKDLMKNILMEAVVYYEKKHKFIEAKEWASENWRKNRFSDMSARNVDKKLAMASESSEDILNRVEEHLVKELESIRRMKNIKDQEVKIPVS
jgi:hypothetical protein